MATYPTDGSNAGTWGADLIAFEDVTRDTTTGKILLLAEKASAMTGVEGDRVVTDKGYVDNFLQIASGTNDTNVEFSLGGLEIKIGKMSLDGTSPDTVTFASQPGLSAFSNNCFQVIVCGGNTTNPGGAINSTNPTATSFKVYYTNANVSPVRFLAIGW